jgi:hypothetical protein
MEDRHRTLSKQDLEKRQEEDIGDRLGECLDKALEDTFPASDPVNVVQPPPKPTDRLHRRGRK